MLELSQSWHRGGGEPAAPCRGRLLPGLWSGCPHKGQGLGKRREPQDLIVEQWKSPGKGNAIFLCTYFHYVPLLEGHRDVMVAAASRLMGTVWVFLFSLFAHLSCEQKNFSSKH